MSELPLVEGVLKYIDEKNISFCMPGHKGGLGFLSTSYGQKLYKEFLKIDITEVDGVDNLHHPDGIIKDSMSLLSKFYGSKKSYFLVNGSTSGNLAMIFSTFKEGDKVIVERNCHRSIFNGIIMRKLKPIFIRNKIITKYNAPLSIDMEHFLCVIRENKDAKGLIVTYPNYYGTCIDLKAIVEEAKKYNMKVLVDSAHGAHFGVHKKLPKSAVKLGADMVVMSSHKTLSSLTQTAFLHVAQNIDTDIVDFYVSSFLSTSPSYMLLCSMDYGRYFLEHHGKEAYNELLERAEFYRRKINELEWLHIIGEEDFSNEVTQSQSYPLIDLSRYVINIKKEYNGYKLSDYLKSKKLQCEMSDSSNVVLIFSPFNGDEDFKMLYKAILECNPEDLKGEQIQIHEIHIPKAEFLPWEIMGKNKRKIEISKAEGNICGNAVVPYPPGIPILNPGEIIDTKSLNMIKYYIKSGVTILGIENGNITIAEE